MFSLKALIKASSLKDIELIFVFTQFRKVLKKSYKALYEFFVTFLRYRKFCREIKFVSIAFTVGKPYKEQMSLIEKMFRFVSRFFLSNTFVLNPFRAEPFNLTLG